MLKITKNDILLAVTVENKQQAIKKAGELLVSNSYVEPSYIEGMLARDLQASTFLGNGVAIPHGTSSSKNSVLNSGIVIIQLSNPVIWDDDGNQVNLLIAIAAQGDDHISILQNLAEIIRDEAQVKTLIEATDSQLIIDAFTGEINQNVIFETTMINLNAVETDPTILHLQNSLALSKVKAIDINYYGQPIISYQQPGITIFESNRGAKKNAIAISRNEQIEHKLVVSVASASAAITKYLQVLLDQQLIDLLQTADAKQIIKIVNKAVFGDKSAAEDHHCSPVIVDSSENNNDDQTQITKILTIVNKNGLHVRPASVIVKLVKEFDAKVTLLNLDREKSKPVSGSSLMRLQTIGAVQGNRLQVTATGNQAQQVIDALEELINNGFGEE